MTQQKPNQPKPYQPKPLGRPVYFDHNATTPIDDRVVAAMRPYLEEHFGNASSASHAYGWDASRAVEQARKQVAQLLGAKPRQIFWTSGATESNNLAILGRVWACRSSVPTPHLITDAIEHKAVLEVFELARRLGCETTVLPVDQFGLVDPNQIEQAIRPNTVLISIMAANNEIGTINPLIEIGQVANRRGIAFHCDAAQGAGKFILDVEAMNISLLSLSAHKIYGPKGVGALYCRDTQGELPIAPLMAGGDQEQGLRPGTVNVAGVVGLGAAAELADQEMASECKRLTELRDQIIGQVCDSRPDVRLNGHPTLRLCNNISLSFKDVAPDSMSLAMSGVAFSSGSACTSASSKVSHVLKGIGLNEDLARATIRLGLGRMTQVRDVELVIAKLLKICKD